MKLYTLFFAIFLSSPLLLLAEPVDKTQALSRAQAYMLARGKFIDARESPKLPQRRRACAVPGSTSEYYYVFNASADNGYVIVSGDDRTPEILGYVERGSFDPDNIPENMQSWLQLYVDQIKYLDDNNVQVDKEKVKSRRKANATRHSIPMIMRTKWNQGYPYNLTCPQYYKPDGTTALPASGCVATALAQVMNHYRYPAKTKVMIPSYTNNYTLSNGSTKTVTVKAVPRNTAIDWDNMCDVYNGNQTGVQDTAVADLMKIIGTAVKMGYGAQSGAVFGKNVVTAFVNYFGYDDSAYMAERGDYTLDEWFDLVYSEIAAGRPVGFSGSSSGGAHAFVLDGFDGEQLFHVNWGWGGGSDGWFLIGILNPGDNSGTGASSSSDGYSMGQNALCNLSLPDNVRVESTTCLTINDITVSGTNIKGNYINWTGSTNSFNAAIVRLNENGTLSPVGGTQSLTGLGNNYFHTLTFNVNGKLPQGTHRLSPASKLASNKTWRPQLDFKREYIEAVVDESNKVTLTYVKPVEDICIDTIVFPGKRIAGEEQEVKVTFRNNGDEYYREVRFFASTNDTKAYTDSRSVVAVRKGETVDVSFFFKPSAAGTYNLWFCTKSDGSGEVGRGSVEIVTKADAEVDKLSVTSFLFSNMVSGVMYGNVLSGKCNIRNTSAKEFNGKIKLQLWRQAAGSNTAWSSSSKTVEMSIAPSKTMPANFLFEGLDNTSTYRIQVLYVGQDGELPGGGLWEHGWKLTPGALFWKDNGTLSATRGSVAQQVNASACGMYVGGYKVAKFYATGNKNPKTIFAINENSNVSTTGLEGRNIVLGSHSDSISFVNGYPFYSPVSFDADTAVFRIPLDEESLGKWSTFTLPFKADSIMADGKACIPNDSLSHVWIYEFAYTDDEGKPVFAPAKELRGNTPYILAFDKWLLGKTLEFTSANTTVFKSETDKMIVSSPTYNMYGTTFQHTLNDVYTLNDEGTAFTYKSESTVIEGLSTYMTTSLDNSSRIESIALPEIPVFPYTEGDVSGDGRVDILDVYVLASFIIEHPATGNVDVADVNGDGVVDGRDMVSLVNKLNKE